MFSSRLINHFGFRLKLMTVGGGAPYFWDPVNQQLIPSGTYWVLQMYLGLFGGCYLILFHIIQLYLQTHRKDIPDVAKEVSQNIVEEKGISAPVMIGFGEILLLICIDFLLYVNITRRESQRNLFNQLILYNKLLNGMVSSGKLQFSPEQKLKIKMAEMIIYLAMTV